MKILKYQIEIIDHQVIRMPSHFHLVDFQYQNGELMMWANIDPDETGVEDLELYIVKTGQDIPNAVTEHLRTVQYAGLVWHIFYAKSK